MVQGQKKYTMLGPPMSARSSQLLRLDTNCAVDGSLRPIFGLGAAELGSLLGHFGEPVWRGIQIAEAIYSQRVR